MRDPLVAAHLDYLRQLGRSPRTIYQRRRSLAILQAFLAAPLAVAVREDLARWRAGMRCGDEAVRHYVTDAHMFYRWLSETAGLRDDNPAENIPVPRPGRRLPRPIGEDDLFRAVSAASGRVRLILVLAGWGGLRAKEIALLRRQYVLDSARPPYLFVARDATKGSAERIIPIGGFVLEELLAHGLPRAGSAYVLPRGDGNPGPNAPHRISGLANDYLAGLGIDATLHQLRHRFATAVHQDSGDIRLVQELLGHSDLRTTQVYAAIDAGRASAVVAALPAPRRLRACG